MVLADLGWTIIGMIIGYGIRDSIDGWLKNKIEIKASVEVKDKKTKKNKKDKKDEEIAEREKNEREEAEKEHEEEKKEEAAEQ
jgi:predicted Holliday junction resolvase-like endonuclease